MKIDKCRFIPSTALTIKLQSEEFLQNFMCFPVSYLIDVDTFKNLIKDLEHLQEQSRTSKLQNHIPQENGTTIHVPVW